MTPGEFREIIKTMKDYGVSHVKMGDLEVNMGGEGSNIPSSSPAINEGGSSGYAEGSPTQQEDPIKHKIEEMTSLMKLSDDALVDRLFPEDKEHGDQE